MWADEFIFPGETSSIWIGPALHMFLRKPISSNESTEAVYPETHCLLVNSNKLPACELLITIHNFYFESESVINLSNYIQYRKRNLSER